MVRRSNVVHRGVLGLPLRQGQATVAEGDVGTDKRIVVGAVPDPLGAICAVVDGVVDKPHLFIPAMTIAVASKTCMDAMTV